MPEQFTNKPESKTKPRTNYELLGVRSDAGPAEIKSAYRRLAKQYHPDLNSGKWANDIMAELNRAYDILSDPDRRQAYDATRIKQGADASESKAEAGARSAPKSEYGDTGRSENASRPATGNRQEAPRDADKERRAAEEDVRRKRAQERRRVYEGLKDIVEEILHEKEKAKGEQKDSAKSDKKKNSKKEFRPSHETAEAEEPQPNKGESLDGIPQGPMKYRSMPWVSVEEKKKKAMEIKKTGDAFALASSEGVVSTLSYREIKDFKNFFVARDWSGRSVVLDRHTGRELPHRYGKIEEKGDMILGYGASGVTIINAENGYASTHSYRSIKERDGHAIGVDRHGQETIIDRHTGQPLTHRYKEIKVKDKALWGRIGIFNWEKIDQSA